jgi:hypothetical protein
MSDASFDPSRFWRERLGGNAYLDSVGRSVSALDRFVRRLRVEISNRQLFVFEKESRS